MAIRDNIPKYLKYIQDNRPYLEENRIKLDIFDGNLISYVKESLRKTLSDNYFSKIQERIIPINVLSRIVNKSSKAYVSAPSRETSDIYKSTVQYYENIFELNTKMQKADEYSNLFKGYALEPFLHNGKPRLRVLPYDRFLPYSDDQVDSTYVTAFIKFMGKRVLTKNGKDTIVEVFHVFTNEEFVSFDTDGDVVEADLVENEGVNPYGVIPFFYGNRGNDVILPTQDTDMIPLTKMVPTLLTDLSGAILFQCFSIVWGIDVNSENLTMSPNAFWSLKSDKTSDKTPSVGTIKPEADIDKVIGFVMTTFTLWLETKGIRVGSIGSIDAGNAASGISKIIDEMDTTEIIQKSQAAFQSDESTGFWPLIAKMSNYWVMNNLISDTVKPDFLGKDFVVTVVLDPPEPFLDRRSEVETLEIERNAGFTSTKRAVTQLNPDMDEDQIEELLEEIEEEKSNVVVSQNDTEVVSGSTESKDQPT